MLDIIIQIGECVDAFNGFVPGGNAREFLLQTVKDQLAQAASDIENANSLYAGIIPAVPVVNSICFGGGERLGITLVDNSGGTNHGPAQPTALDTQQITELQNVQLPRGTEFSVQVTGQALNRILSEVWAKLTSANGHVDSTTLQPDPNGDLELKSYFLSLAGSIVLIVNGTYLTRERTAPNVPIEAVSIDTYSVQPVRDGATIKGNIVDTSTSSIDTHLSALRDWENGLEAAAGILFGPYGLIPISALQTYIQQQITSGLAGVSFGPSIGALFQTLFIPQVLIPGTSLKLIVNYTSVTVDPINGILATAQATPSIAPRNPSVWISGPAVVSEIDTTRPAYGLYNAMSIDIDDPAPATWSGQATFSSVVPPGQDPDDLQKLATFPMVYGNPVYKTISVELNDNTGLGPFKGSMSVLVQRAIVTTPNKPAILQPKRI